MNIAIIELIDCLVITYPEKLLIVIAGICVRFNVSVTHRNGACVQWNCHSLPFHSQSVTNKLEAQRHGSLGDDRIYLTPSQLNSALQKVNKKNRNQITLSAVAMVSTCQIDSEFLNLF